LTHSVGTTVSCAETDRMGRLAGVLLVVCVCLLLSVSLVQSRRRRSIPRFCKQFINPRAQANDVADVDKVDTASSEGDDEDDDEDDDDDYDEDYDYSSDEDEEVEFDGPIQVAEEEVNMLHLVIDFMTYVLYTKGPFTPSASTSVYVSRCAQNRAVLDFERVYVCRRT